MIVVIWGNVFHCCFVAGIMITDWTNDVLIGEVVQGNLRRWMEIGWCGKHGWSACWWIIIGGVGAVIGFFVPQIAILFFLMSILEDCGYMSRVAFIMDRIFRKFGLSGKAFIPLLISSECGVPGIMATRTMENNRDRRDDDYADDFHFVQCQNAYYCADGRSGIPG